MIIKDYSVLVKSILSSAEYILSEKDHYNKGDFFISTKRIENYLQMARSMKGLMDLDSSGQKKNYRDYLDWQKMYERASKCHLLLENLIDFGCCSIPPERDDNMVLNALRNCLADILDNEDADYNSDVDNLKTTWGQLIKSFTETEEIFQKWLKAVLPVFEEFFDHFDDSNEGYVEAIVSTYYDYLEENEDDIRDELCNLIFDKKILSSYCEEPNAEHYGELLKEMLEQARFNIKTRIIAEKYTHSRAIDIRKAYYINYLPKECKTDNDVMLFLSTFAQIAILQELTKERIQICRRPEMLMPLPEVVNISINDDIQMNKMFREIIGKLQSTVGGSYRKKWSHVKRVMEDEGIMMETNDTEFGRVMHEICPDINQENCRTNVKNNPVTPPENDRGKKYYEWGTMTKGKQECMNVAKEFAPILKKMHSTISE